MDFDQMQIVWDEQKRQRLYALDLDALHASVQQRGRRIARGVQVMELGVIAISIASVGFLAAKSLVEHTSRPLLPAAGLVAAGVYLLVERLRRRARERRFASNLLGDLDLAIAQLDYHIRRIRTFPLWFCAPVCLALLASLVSKFGSKPWWMWLAGFAAFPLSIYVTRLELRCLVPRKRELEALRAKLSNET